MIARAPHAIALETADYIVRTLETGDASEAFREWLADPDTARMLNAPTRHLSAEAVRDYIASFDRVKAHLLGIFEKATGRLVGIRAVYINWPQREFLVNVLIGEKDARNKGARTQSRTAVYRHFFETLDLDLARATVLADNAAVLGGMSKRGWIEDGRDARPQAEGTGFVEVVRFRLPRDVWRKRMGLA